MPIPKPVLIAGAVTAVGVLGGILTKLAPQLRSWLDNNVSEKDVTALKNALKGAYAVVSAIAEATPGFPLDDGLAKVLELASTEFEAARGRPPTSDETQHMAHVALTLHADTDVPGSLAGKGGANDVAKAAANLTK